MSNTYGIMAEFSNAGTLLHAAEKVHEAGYSQFETYSPFPIHGMDHAMGLGQSKIGWLSLIGGLLGCSGGIVLQVWTSAYSYPLVISGKEFASLPAFVPVTFELSILFTAFFTVFGMFALNNLPQWYHAIFNHSTFEKASSHGFFLSIDSKDPQYNEEKSKALLEKHGGHEIETIRDADEN